MSKWKLVPVEPTQAMIDATNSVPEGAGYLSCVRAYRAMLDAAPAWQAEPVAWVRNLTDAHPHCVTGLQFRSAADVDAGVLYTPLYATPPSAELARLRAENERLKADAARLDSGVIAIDAEPGLFANPLTSQVIFKGDLRKYIDEAIEQDTPEWRAKYCVP